MTIKQMMFAVMILISTHHVTFSMFRTSQKKDFVFDERMHTKVKGNSIFAYIRLRREQTNPSYVFKHTRVVECTKDKQLTEIGTLGQLQKAYVEAYYSSPSGGFDPAVTRFEKFGKMNNAIYCADLEQKLNYFDKLEDVGAIVYGTQDVKDCVLVREYLKQQELATKK